MVERYVRLFDEDIAQIAADVDPECALSQALRDLRARRAKGETVALMEDSNGIILVGPIPKDLLQMLGKPTLH